MRKLDGGCILLQPGNYGAAARNAQLFYRWTMAMAYASGGYDRW
jgi:hypothetical protein